MQRKEKGAKKEMKNPVENQQDEFFDKILESIKPKDEEYIERRIHHVIFAKIIVWLCSTSREKNVFSLEELRAFLHIHRSSVHDYIKGLVESNYLRREIRSYGKIEYIFVRDGSNKVKLTEYFERAAKVLGLKPKKEIILSLEEEKDLF